MQSEPERGGKMHLEKTMIRDGHAGAEKRANSKYLRMWVSFCRAEILAVLHLFLAPLYERCTRG